MVQKVDLPPEGGEGGGGAPKPEDAPKKGIKYEYVLIAVLVVVLIASIAT